MKRGALVRFDDVASQRTVEDAADVVIVGSGAGGATAARVLTEAGLEVVILEEGPHIPTEQLRSDIYTTTKVMWRDNGFQAARGRSFTPVLQGSVVGGTTAINGAIIHRLPEEMRRLWCEEHGAGELLRPEDLARVYDQLDRELFVAPAPEDVLGENAKRMRAGLEVLGFRGNPIRRNVNGCRGSAHCHQGCPTARRQSMNNSYVPRSIEAGARLYASCKALRVVARRGRATGVVARSFDRLTGRKGPKVSITARRAVIVAASAIQTPLLLEASGIGRASGLVGKRLQAHPGTGVVGLFDEPIQMWFGATQGFESTHFWNERMKFETIALPLEFLATRVPGVGGDLVRQLASYGNLSIFGMQVRARAMGRVRPGPFGRASITYSITDEDTRVLKLGVKRLVHMMFAAGAREIFPGVHGLPDRITSAEQIEPILDLPDDPQHFHCIMAHLFGTAKMGPTARTGVVGPTLESYEMPGLYVLDSSVFPTNIGVNPQHTICAFSWLASERIANA
jgi:choline dehydrogenase-like flavoprotein